MTEKLVSESTIAPRWHRIVKLVLSVIALLGCYWLIANSARAGLSRSFSTMSILESAVEPADVAVRLAPKDPEAHYTRALALVNVQRLEEAIAELKEATRLRPRHYYEWLDLGVTLERVGDRDGALSALTESIRLAPEFSQPHLQLGNFYFRDGRYDQAFAEMRQALRSDPSLIDGILTLAWVASNGDVPTFTAYIQPDFKRTHLEVGRFLAARGKGAESAAEIVGVGSPEGDEERLIVSDTISLLIAAKQFTPAFRVWRLEHSELGTNDDKSVIVNGDFTDPIVRDEPGFAWQLPPLRNVSVAIDPSGPVSGSRSLRFEFAGDFPTGADLLSQLLPVRPRTHYSISFTVKAQDLLTGGLPALFVVDANNPTKVLGQSKPLTAPAGQWTNYQLEFITDGTADVVVLTLRRVACAQGPCPIFGKFWVSRFSLQVV